MLRTTRLTTQHHNPADWNIFYTRFLLAENIKITCLGCDGLQLNRRGYLRGRNRLHLHDQPWLHTNTPQQTATHAIPTILSVLFNACCIIMVPLCLPAKSQHCCMVLLVSAHSARYFYQHMSLYIFFTSLNYASSLPNPSTVRAQFIFQFSSKSLTTETSWDL